MYLRFRHDLLKRLRGKRSRADRRQADRQLVPLVVIHRKTERTERLGQRKQPLDVVNAVFCIIVAHV